VEGRQPRPLTIRLLLQGIPLSWSDQAPHSGSSIGSRSKQPRAGPTTHNGLVGGSNPPGPTMHACGSFVFNGLAPKLSSVIPMLDENLFTIRPR
jgi:hypothetical protein